MPLPPSFRSLKLPVVAAPMFLVSGPKLVTECCKRGVVGTFPSLNQRSVDGFEEWLKIITTDLAEFNNHATRQGTPPAAPFGVNLIVHKTNPRLKTDLALCVKYKVPLVITSLGAVRDLVDEVHGYGGVVFHDVINIRHARKAASAGVDGIIAVCSGAGGHAGTTSPLALLPEIRREFDGTILLSGCISTGDQVLAAQALGADLAYVGTRFINTAESLAGADYKELIKEASSADILYTDAISGVAGNYIKQSITRSGVELSDVAMGQGRSGKMSWTSKGGAKAWTDIKGAGQGVGSITDNPSVAELLQRLQVEYRQAHKELTARASKL